MPTTAFKSDPLVRLMRRRIEDGYYSVKPIPSERGLARESGLSLTCVRRAISQLLEDEVLQRYDNGRLRPAMVPQGNGGQRKIQALLLSPITGGLSSYHWQEGALQAVREHGGLLRVTHFLDEDDPALLSVLGQDFDLIFFIPPDRLSEVLRNRLVQCRGKIFTLYRDMTEIGLSRISDVPDSAVDLLLDQLTSLGHRHIDCVHCHAGYREYEQRIKRWQAYIENKSLDGRLWDCTGANATSEDRKVRSCMAQVFKSGQSSATALLGLSVITGWGLNRAVADAGLRIPDDLSLAVFGPAEYATQSVPALTSLRQPPIKEMISRAISHFIEHGLDEPTVIEPSQVQLQQGESTRQLERSG